MIRIDRVSHTFGGGDRNGTQALKNVDLTVGEGRFVAAVGPSGCGKSTLLALISGLEPVQKGAIEVAGEPVAAIRRDVGMVLQSDVLLPWRTVRGNIELPLEVRRIASAERARRVEEWIGRIGLAGFIDHRPKQLSGGMRKRVQLAATMVYSPSVLLMDEPFSALDAFTRARMQSDLLEIWQLTRATVLFVTHDLDEAIALADEVVVFTARPGTIKATYRVAIPRPRDVSDIQSAPGFADLRHRIWADLRDEVERSQQWGAEDGTRGDDGAIMTDA